MASVELHHVWLHEADDHAENSRLRARNITATPERKVERRPRAGGRVQMISTPLRQRTVSFDAIQVPRTDIDWLDDRLGELLMFRDPRGRVLFGFLADLPTDEHLWTEKADLDLTFRAITYSIEV